MIRINVSSIFRDSQTWYNRFINQVPRFFNQLAEQQLPNDVEINKIVCVYTESNDNTLEILKQEKNNRAAFDIEIIERKSNYKAVRSVYCQDRLRELSSCANAGLNIAKDDCDYVLFCESDLIIYDTFLLCNLLGTFFNLNNIGCVSPLIFLDTNRNCFYDTLCFKDLRGKNWKNNKPYNEYYTKCKQYIEMLCVGSCSLVNSSLLNNVNFGESGYLDFCKKIMELNKKIIVNKNCIIYHPSNANIMERWI